jgi:urease accessory protein
LTEGIAEIGFAQSGGVTRLTHLYQRDPLRVLFPTPAVGDPPLAVLLTTSGGLVGGDGLDIEIHFAEGAAAHLTASAADKIYRSLGPTTVIRQSLSVAAGAASNFCSSRRSYSTARVSWREDDDGATLASRR